MIRIWLGPDDLARTRLLPAPPRRPPPGGTRADAETRPRPPRWTDGRGSHHPGPADAEAQIRQDMRVKAGRMAVAGVEGLFAVIHPSIRWHNPVLIVDTARDVDLRPNGAGLAFVPSVGATRPWVGTDPAALFITYPVDAPFPPRAAVGPPEAGPPRAVTVLSRADDPLAALLGRSRAAVLRAALDLPGTTTDLARRVGISVPSASQHLTVLRAAGLLTTARHGKTARHAPTPLAHALLAGAAL